MIAKGARIGQGQTAEIFAWGEHHVLKLFFEHRSARQATYEARIARLIHVAGVASPAPVALVESEGRPGIIYERIDGPSLLNVLQAQPWRFQRIARTLAETHATLRGNHLSGLPTVRAHLERRIRTVEHLSTWQQRAALATLARLPDGDALCHGDLHPGNLLVSPRGVTIIDWENATIGHPLADVARTSLVLNMAYLHINVRLRLLPWTVLALLNACYCRHYLQLTGYTRRELQAWMLPVAAARLNEGIHQEERQLIALVTRLTRR